MVPLAEQGASSSTASNKASGCQCSASAVTSRATSEGFDFVSRFFAPGLGIAEDAVTGSAHCSLAPYWAEKLGNQIAAAA